MPTRLAWSGPAPFGPQGPTHSPRSTAPVVLTASLYLLLAISAAVPWTWCFGAAAALLVLAELWLSRRAAVTGELLERVGAGTALRAAVRGLLIVLLAARTMGADAALVTSAAVLFAAALHVTRSGLAEFVLLLRRPPLLSRNIRLDVAFPGAPSPRLLHPLGLETLVELPAAVGVVLAAGGGPVEAITAGALTTVVVAAVPAALLGMHVVRLRRGNVREQVVRNVSDQLRQNAPEVVLYFGGSTPAIYQVQMWLETVERLSRPAVVVLRNHEVLAALEPTSLPVISAEGAFAQLDFSKARVVLYVSSGSDNLPMMAHRGPRSVFVGHVDGNSASPQERSPQWLFDLCVDAAPVAMRVGPGLSRWTPGADTVGPCRTQTIDHRLRRTSRRPRRSAFAG